MPPGASECKILLFKVIIGVAGVIGCVLIDTFRELIEVHPRSFATVKVYVPGVSQVTVVLIPIPLVTITPGVLIKVQVPVVGKPFRITFPVATEQVGWVIVPIVGAAGVKG